MMTRCLRCRADTFVGEILCPGCAFVVPANGRYGMEPEDHDE
jgi:hypothetical protein